MKYFFLFASILTVSFLNSCTKPKDVNCDIAYLNVYNNHPTKAVVFKWITEQKWDTIMPGETTTATAENVKVEYAIDGSITSISTSYIDFETDGATYTYRFEKCDETINAPGGFIQLDANCDNGEYNPETGELDTDCGGFCVPCTPPTFTCSTNTNQITWNSGFTADNLSSTRIDSGFTMNITFSLQRSLLKAIINHTSLPTETKRFDIGVLPHQMILSYSKGYSSYEADENQSVYIVKDANGEYFLQYCDITFSDGGLSFTGSATVALNK